MVFERGPQGKLHAPAYRNGCYHGRLTDCCFLCMGRIVLSSTTSPLRYRAAQRDNGHDLLGERVVVPYVDHSSASYELNYRRGIINDIYVLSGDDPDLLTVKTDEDEYIHINLAPNERRGAVEVQSESHPGKL